LHVIIELTALKRSRRFFALRTSVVISKKSDSGVLDERIRARLQGVPRSTGDPVTHRIQFIGVR